MDGKMCFKNEAPTHWLSSPSLEWIWGVGGLISKKNWNFFYFY
jgi:hypothetical protein